MVTCFLRYWVAAGKLADFEHYASVWMRIVARYGGTHYGYFLPGETPPSASFSFTGIGETGPDDVAIAMFSFPDIEAYEKYRREVAKDPECKAITKHYEATKCFTRYERTFVRALE